MAACENVRRDLCIHAENKRKAFGELYRIPPTQLSCCSASEVLENESNDSADDESTRGHAIDSASRDQAKRDAYIRECMRVLDDWWKKPLATEVLSATYGGEGCLCV